MFAKLFRAVYRPPDYLIGNEGDWYLRRWYVIPRNRFFNVYLHNMLRDDDDRALHDHPWWNLSIVLRGGYWEFMPSDPDVGRRFAEWPWDAAEFSPVRFQAPFRRVWRSPGSFVLRGATDAHRLALESKKPSWSLFITGRRLRVWGFWCPKGWKPWQEFVDMTAGGSTIGAGCGEP